MHTYHHLVFSEVIPDISRRFASQSALSFVGEPALTYKMLGDSVSATMAFLEKNGVSPGEKVVIYSQNMPNWGIVYFALQCMGIVAVPVLPDFNSFELQNVLNHSEAKVIFISNSLEYKLDEVKSDYLSLIVRIDDFKIIESKKQAVEFFENAKCVNSYQPNEDDLSVLLYTSGTTGESKGVMLSQKNILSNVIQSNEIQEILVGDKFLSVLPLSHTYENTIGLILPLVNGACIYYLKKPPVASVLLPALQIVKPDLMLTVPLIIEKVYKTSILPEIQKKAITRYLFKSKIGRKLIHRLAGKKLYQKFGGKLKFFGIGGAKLDAQVEQFLRDAKFPYAIGYGLTETSPLLAGSNSKETKFQFIGNKVINCQLKINNPNPLTGEGEIWAKGPNVMLGYYKNEEKTNEVLTSGGWFKTGDLGVFDKKGRLAHKGRLKNIIVGANGENIYPEEIESLINNFKHVIESIVIEQKGKLVAFVHFNREELEQKFKGLKLEISNKVDDKLDEITQKVDETVNDLAAELHHYINSRVNKVSRIQLLIVQDEPFQKTATQKIKRYLYS